MSRKLLVRGLVGAWPALRVGRVRGVKVPISCADSGAEEWALAGTLGPTPRPLRQARGIVLLVAGLVSCAPGCAAAAAIAETRSCRAVRPSTIGGSRPVWAGRASSMASSSSPSGPPGASPRSRNLLACRSVHPTAATRTPRATTALAIAETHSAVIAAGVNTVGAMGAEATGQKP